MRNRTKVKRHGGRNRPSTEKQTAAQKRNFSIFRLRGMVVSLNIILYRRELNPIANARLLRARNNIKEALRVETGK